jgi:hypothetical protein
MTDHERSTNQQSSIDPADMPPLGPTAEVPAIHSDTLNDPRYWNQVMEAPSAKVPAEHRDEKKPNIGKRVIAGIAGAAVLGGGAFVGVKALGGSSSDQPKPKAEATTTQVTNVAGDVLTVKTRDGQPYTDWNEDSINDFTQDVDDDGIKDGFQYTANGLNAEPGPEDHSKDPLVELPINNSLTEDQVNDILSTTDLTDWHSNAFYEIRNFEEDRAQALWQVYEKYKDDLTELQLTVDLMVLWDDNWKEVLYDGPGK